MYSILLSKAVSFSFKVAKRDLQDISEGGTKQKHFLLGHIQDKFIFPVTQIFCNNLQNILKENKQNNKN